MTKEIARWCGCNWLLLECGTTRPALLAEVVVTWALFAVVVVVGAMAVDAVSHCRLRERRALSSSSSCGGSSSRRRDDGGY